MDLKKLGVGNLVILIAGIVMLVASFLAFYDFGGGTGLGDIGDIAEELGIEVDVPSTEANAWDTGLFAIATLPAIIGAVMAVVVALTSFANVKLPERPLGLTWNQIHLALGVHAALMMIAFLIVDSRGADKGIGFWLMLLGAIALAVGAVLRERESAAPSV